MKRKIIQISACSPMESQSHQTAIEVFALCNDGTVWANDCSTTESEWWQLPKISQSDVRKETP